MGRFALQQVRDFLLPGLVNISSKENYISNIDEIL